MDNTENAHGRRIAMFEEIDAISIFRVTDPPRIQRYDAFWEAQANHKYKA
jgi:hypothetical protein